MSFQIVNLASVYYIGHAEDTIVMAGLGMGNVLISAICMAFCFGLNGTLESKVSQSYGAKDYEMCGIWLNRGRAIATCLMLPISILFLSSGTILKAIGQDARVAD